MITAVVKNRLKIIQSHFTFKTPKVVQKGSTKRSTAKMKKIDFEITIDNYKEDIKRLYTMLRPHVRLDEISECREIDQGIVNLIWKVNDQKSDEPVVVRVYLLRLLQSVGEEEREMQKNEPPPIDRRLELEVLQAASELGITAKMFATFKNGFIYKYVDGLTNCFEAYDLSVARQVAIKMARLHRIRLADGLAQSKPGVSWILRDDCPELVREQRALFDKKMKESEFEELRSQLPAYSSLAEEYERLQKMVAEKDALGPVCICHNDLNFGNLLIDRQTKEPFFIDFEWVSNSL